MSLPRKILETKILCQTVCNITKRESTQTEIKVLYFIDEYESCTPSVLISKLGIVKSNLALLTKKMIKDNLIIAKKSLYDKRSIFYSITPTGKKMLNEYLLELEKVIHKNEYEVEQSLNKVLDYLNKKV